MSLVSPSGGATRTTSSRRPAPRPRRARRRPVDERLELLVVGRQRLGERDEPPDGVLRAAEAHRDPAGLDRHAGGQARARRAASAARGTATRIPVSRAWRIAVTTRCAARRLAAEGGPCPVLPSELAQELRRAGASLVARSELGAEVAHEHRGAGPGTRRAPARSRA